MALLLAFLTGPRENTLWLPPRLQRAGLSGEGLHREKNIVLSNSATVLYTLWLRLGLFLPGLLPLPGVPGRQMPEVRKICAFGQSDAAKGDRTGLWPGRVGGADGTSAGSLLVCACVCAHAL